MKGSVGLVSEFAFSVLIASCIGTYRVCLRNRLGIIRREPFPTMFGHPLCLCHHPPLILSLSFLFFPHGMEDALSKELSCEICRFALRGFPVTFSSICCWYVGDLLVSSSTNRGRVVNHPILSLLCHDRRKMILENIEY